MLAKHFANKEPIIHSTNLGVVSAHEAVYTVDGKCSRVWEREFLFLQNYISSNKNMGVTILITYLSLEVAVDSSGAAIGPVLLENSQGLCALGQCFSNRAPQNTQANH